MSVKWVVAGVTHGMSVGRKGEALAVTFLPSDCSNLCSPRICTGWSTALYLCLDQSLGRCLYSIEDLKALLEDLLYEAGISSSKENQMIDFWTHPHVCVGKTIYIIPRCGHLGFAE